MGYTAQRVLKSKGGPYCYPVRRDNRSGARVDRLYPTNDSLLGDLVRLHEREGKITRRVINRRAMASVNLYLARFGSLDAAYERTGLKNRRRSDFSLIEDLVRLHKRVGRLSCGVITCEAGLASGQTYRDRFGSLAAAYHLAGLAEKS